MKPVPHWNLFAQKLKNLIPSPGRRFIISVDFLETLIEVLDRLEYPVAQRIVSSKAWSRQEGQVEMAWLTMPSWWQSLVNCLAKSTRMAFFVVIC
jgi:hypothetical protein